MHVYMYICIERRSKQRHPSSIKGRPHMGGIHLSHNTEPIHAPKHVVPVP